MTGPTRHSSFGSEEMLNRNRSQSDSDQSAEQQQQQKEHRASFPARLLKVKKFSKSDSSFHGDPQIERENYPTVTIEEKREKEQKNIPMISSVPQSPLSYYIDSRLLADREYWPLITERGWWDITGKIKIIPGAMTLCDSPRGIPNPPVIQTEPDDCLVTDLCWLESVSVYKGTTPLFLLQYLEHWVDFLICLLKSGPPNSPITTALNLGAIHNPIVWWHIQGYNLFTEQIMKIMRLHLGETECMKAASRFLLTDTDLLSEYLAIIIPRTSAHDSKGVMFLFDCLNDWWKTLKDNSLSLPETFEFDLLLKCFDILIEIDYHVTLGLLFQFLHTHLVSFSAVLSFWKRIVGEKILGSWFFRFFLHWDFKIRCTFHQLVVFQVASTPTPPNFSEERAKEFESIQTEMRFALEHNLKIMREFQIHPENRHPLIGEKSQVYIAKAVAEYECYGEYKNFWMERCKDRFPTVLGLQDVLSILKKNNIECAAAEYLRIPKPQILMSLEETSKKHQNREIIG